MWPSKVKMDPGFHGDDKPLKHFKLVATLIVSNAETHNKNR